MRRLFRAGLPLIDFLLVVVGTVAALAMRLIRRAGIGRLPRTLKVLRKFGVFPIRDHYYEPLFNPAHLRKPLGEDRELPGIDWNLSGQLELLKRFQFNDELVTFPLTRRADLEFFYNNDTFASGDAEFLYNIIRHFKPRKILEIGSGYSTMLASSAVKANQQSGITCHCEHVCIEPYEAAW